MIDEVPQTIQDLELLAKGPFWLKEVGSQYDTADRKSVV